MAYGPMVKEMSHWESLWFMLSAPLNLIEIRKMRGNFARVWEGVTDSRMDLYIWYVFFWFAENRQLIIIIFQWSTTNKSRWKGIFKPTPFTKRRTAIPAKPAWPPLSETTPSRCPVKVMVGADYGDYRKHHSATTTRWNGMARGPGKNLSAARVESAQLASLMASKMERMTWKWLELEHLAVELDTKFSLVWLLISGSTCATNVTKKEFAIQFAQKCGWKTWGMLKSKNQYVVTIITPLNHPHPKGVADVVTFLRWKKSMGRFQALSPWSVHVLVQEAQVFHGHLRTVIGEVSGNPKMDSACSWFR